MFHHKVKKEKAEQGKGKRGNEREGERTPRKPLTRKCQSLRKEKAIESSDREEQKKKPGKLKESLFLILPLFLSTLPSFVPRDARCARFAQRFYMAQHSADKQRAPRAPTVPSDLSKSSQNTHPNHPQTVPNPSQCFRIFSECSRFFNSNNNILERKN